MIYIGNIKDNIKKTTISFKCDRSSPLGNPFPLSKYTRDESIRKYREYFYNVLVNHQLPDMKAVALLRQIKSVADVQDVTLLCWCAPLPCHTEVIKEFIELWQQREIDSK